jgi:hypothetical protein
LGLVAKANAYVSPKATKRGIAFRRTLED